MRTSTRLLPLLLFLGCTIHQHPVASGESAAGGPVNSAGSTQGSDVAARAGESVTTDSCAEALIGGLADVFAAPHEYHDSPNHENIPSVMVGTLLGEVSDSDPRVRARFVELVGDGNAKVRRTALRFMVEDPAGWRQELEAYLDGSAEPRERRIALGGLVGIREPALVARVRVAAARELQAGRIPVMESRILSAARDAGGREVLDAVWAACPRRDPGDREPATAREQWDQCAEIAVYRHGFGGPAVAVRSALRDAVSTRRMAAVRALAYVEPDVALPHLLAALSSRQPEIGAFHAAEVARVQGLHTHPAVLGHMRRHASSGHAYSAPIAHALPDDDPLAERLLVALAQEEGTSAAETVAELIRRGSAEGYRFLENLQLHNNGDYLKSYLGSWHTTAHVLRGIGDEQVDRYLDGQLASSRHSPAARLGVALVLAQRARAAGHTPRAISPLVSGALRDADPYARMLAAAACLAAAAPPR